TPDAGLNKLITFSGFTLTGTNAAAFALPGTAICCTPNIQRTTGNISAGVLGVLPAAVVQTTPILPFIGLPLLAGLQLGVEGGITMPPIPVVEAPVEEVVVPA